MSVYINHKKCFAFVELKSIELTTACLELDGIVYRNSVLKVQRANEYKPEAVAALGARPAIKLNLPPEVFSGAVSIPSVVVQDNSEPRLTSLIVQGTMASIERGAIVLLGFPFDEGSRRSPTGRPGGANAPKIVRRFIGRQGGLVNPEFGFDIGNLLLIDIGDIPVGLTLDEAHARLAFIIAEIVHRGGIPFVIGGSNDMSYFSAAGLMTVAGGAVGVLNVSSQLHVKPPNSDNKIHAGCTFRLLLEDTRFCPPRNGLSSMPSCEGKLVNFGCQGSMCSNEQAKYVTDRNGRVMWLTKDIRGTKVNPDSPRNNESFGLTTSVAKVFRRALSDLSEGATSADGSPKPRRPVMVSFNMEATASAACPGLAYSSSIGFTADEMLEMCFVAGTDPNVVLIDISEFNPDMEEPRSGKLVSDMFYYYALGVASRTLNKVIRQNYKDQPSAVAPISELSSHGVNMSAQGIGFASQVISQQQQQTPMAYPLGNSQGRFAANFQPTTANFSRGGTYGGPPGMSLDSDSDMVMGRTNLATYNEDFHSQVSSSALISENLSTNGAHNLW